MMKIIDNILASVEFNGNFCVIGIDGPTASGKTTLADDLCIQFKKRKIQYFIYRLDWTLIERRERRTQFECLFKKKSPFEFEADLHMDLQKAKDFLEIIEKDRYSKKFNKRTIHLNRLYSREDDGKCTGSVNFTLKKNMVILVEGHYTHHRLLRRYFDLNYLLLAKPEELIRRKSARVASYRDKDTVKKYFSLIDLPSFSHYYYQNLPFINRIVLNETFESQEIISHQLLQKIVFRKTVKKSCSPGHAITPAHFNDSDQLIKSINLFFGKLGEIHDQLIQLWGIHPQYRTSGFKKKVEGYLCDTGFVLKYGNFFWQKSNEFSYELGLCLNETYFIVSGDLHAIKVMLSSRHTHCSFRLDCNANGLTKGAKFKLLYPEKNPQGKQYLIMPNKFLVPNYLSSFGNIKRKFYQASEKIWEYAGIFFSNPSFIVYKASSKEQLDFYKNFLSLAGYEIVTTAAYLFADNLKGRIFTECFSGFSKCLPKLDNSPDHSISAFESDCAALKKLGLTLTEDQLMISENADISKVSAYYNKASDITKNRITQILKINYADRKISNDISIKSYIRNLPVPLREFYFSLFISKLGAVPFITLYHTKPDSADIQKYFDYYSKKNKPFGVQASLSALGIANNYNGYLGIKGPKALAKVVKENLFSFLAENPDCNLPVWGLGIDHAVNDTMGTDKVFAFIKEAKKSQWFTSYCADVSTYINEDLKHLPCEFIKDFVRKTFSIINNNFPDIEFYLGNEQVFEQMPLDASLAVYEKLSADFRKTAIENNHDDFFLLGPFLGTLHHRSHKNVNLGFSDKIFDICSLFGFIGNVLHGTSYTPHNQIKALVRRNCIRVNYAGKLLEAMVKAFPDDVKKNLGNSQNEWKRNFIAQKPKIIEKSKKIMCKNLEDVLNEIENSVGLLEMSEDEAEWFRHDHVCLPGEDFGEIIKDIFGKRDSKKTKYTQKKYDFLASMIEVPYSKFAGGLADKIIKSGINHFHVDIGDGYLISRNLDGFEKLEYLGKHHKEIITHVHMMVEDPFTMKKRISFISKVSAAKSSLIYIHPESFRFVPSWERGAFLVRQSGSEAGVVLAVNEKMELLVFLKKMKEAAIHNILVMGVPIGRGGQSFSYETIERIRDIRKWAVRNKYEIQIEVDGGLSDAVIPECIDAGVHFLSGWSMFLKYGLDNIEKRINELLNG